MMRSKFRSGFVLLVAVFALSAVGAASASAALPEFVPGPGEKLTKAVTISGATEVSFHTPQGYIDCKSGSGVGSITGPKTLTMQFTFEQCGYTNLHCGTIKTELLKAALVYISKSSKEVGIDFNQYPHKKMETPPPFANFTCEGINEAMRGAVIAKITPLNIKTKTYILSFVQKEGVQIPTEYENEEGGKVLNQLETTSFGNGDYRSSMEARGAEGKSEVMFTSGETELKA